MDQRMKVVEDITPRANKRVVEELEAILKEAKAGGITGFALAAVGPIHVYTYRIGMLDLYRQVGLLECLKAELLLGNDDEIQNTIVRVVEER